MIKKETLEIRKQDLLDNRQKLLDANKLADEKIKELHDWKIQNSANINAYNGAIEEIENLFKIIDIQEPEKVSESNIIDFPAEKVEANGDGS